LILYGSEIATSIGDLKLTTYKSTHLKPIMQEIPSKKAVGERIKNLRKKNKLSQVFISDQLGISRSNYSQIELGNQFPSYTSLHIIARYYSKSYEWLLHGEESAAIGTVSENEQEIDKLIENLEITIAAIKKSLKIFREEQTGKI